MKTIRNGGARSRAASAVRLLLAGIATLFVTAVPTVVLTAGSTASASPPDPTYGSAVVDGNDGEWNLVTDSYAPMYLAGNSTKGVLANGYLRYDCTSGTLDVLVLQASSSDPIGTSASSSSVGGPYGGNAWAEIDGGSSKQYTDSDTTDASHTPPEFAWVGLNYDGNGDAQGYEASFAIAPGNHTIVVHAEVILSGTANTAAFLGFGAHPSGTVALDIPASCTNSGGSTGSSSGGTTGSGGGGTPAISLTTDTNGVHYSSAPGATAAVGSTMDWTYLVTNTGNVSLSSVGVSDDQGVVVSCPSTTLAADASETCTATGTATVGQYHNIATASGTYGTTVVTAQDQSWYDGLGDPLLVGPTPRDPASTPYTRTYNWTINKTASRPTTSSQTDAYSYDVTVTEKGYSDSDFALDGVVTLTNTNNQALTGVTVTDVVDNGGTCQVANGANLTIAALSAITLDYTCTWASSPSALSGNDTATAAWDPTVNHTPNSSTQVVTPFAFGAPSTTVDKTVTVTDSMKGQLGTVTATDAQPYASRDFSYTVDFPTPTSGCQTYPNTALLSETGQSATATVCAPSDPATNSPSVSGGPSGTPSATGSPSDPPVVDNSNVVPPKAPADPVSAREDPASQPLPFTGDPALEELLVASALILVGMVSLAISLLRRS